MLAEVGVRELAVAAVVTLLAAVPISLSVWALLDATRRPSWAWALSGRTQVAWVAGVLVGVLLVPLGLAVSGWYLLRVRPDVRAAERGAPPEA